MDAIVCPSMILDIVLMGIESDYLMFTSEIKDRCHGQAEHDKNHLCFTANSQVESHLPNWVLLLQVMSGVNVKVAELEGNLEICDKEDDTSCDQVRHLPAYNV